MIVERDKVQQKYKWDMQDIFPSDQQWEEKFSECERELEKFPAYMNRLSDRDVLLECLKLYFGVHEELSRLYQYAKLYSDTDTRDTRYQGMANRTENLIVRFASVTSFLQPETAELSKERLTELANDPEFADYDVFLKEIIRSKNIILSKEEEKILSEVGMFASTNDDVFNMFDNADLKFKPVRDGEGNLVELTHGTYSILLQDPSQRVRARAFESMFGAYKQYINMLAANYAGNLKKDWFFGKIRGFSSSLEYAMYLENVPSVCYKKLLKAVNEGNKTMHRYMALRKKLLGLRTQNMYDIYLPIVQEQGLSIGYDEAVKLVKEALGVMGKEYGEVLAHAFDNRWVDVYESAGKRSGAYSWGVSGVHPYVLLNYQPTVHDVFTIAHELGHSMHSYYSSQAQPYSKSNYEIFCAEIASTVNEVLLLKHLLKTAEGDFRKYLLAYYLDMFRMTLFRQAMFSEFEVKAHELVEQNMPVTADALSDIYYELNKKYYGRSMRSNDLIRYEWARVPHFYSSYYVYKYATGITAAVSIADNILTYGAPYFEKYKKFLSAGGSMPPIDIIKLADVDLTSDAPYKKAMDEFKKTLAELERATEL